ncbi:MAG: site-2 protease family protein [Candidatus Heimdallarchaeota archaeon]|nr:site-2 protease family protein [Candidatus Heimdallarchaeota archaeon]MBY8994555.1 site-2 protease family protein [Candidatus Heimdallarchaeota archaeon]
MHWGYTLLIIAVIWFLVYLLGRYFKVDERFDWTLGPLFLLMRTRRFNKVIKRIAKKYARFWRIFGNVSIFFGLLMTLASIGLLIFSLTNFFKPIIPMTGPTVGILIPGVTISFRTFLYLIIPIILMMIPHELAHGVVSHADGVELRSTGLAFFAIFFGAFVEPEEEDLMKSSYKTRMRTFASGMFPNLLLGLLTIPVFIFSSNIIAPFYLAPDGVLIHEVVKDTAADTGGLKRGIAIFDINTTHIDTYETFSTYMNNTKPNDLLVLNTTEGTINIRLNQHPDFNQSGYLGVRTITYLPPKFPWVWKFFPYFFEQELMWTLVVSFGSVLFNALPIPFILDGDKLLSSFLFQYMKNKKLALIILDVFRFLALALFLAVLIIPLFKYGFVPFG